MAGHITILPWNYSSIGQGTWIILIDVSQILNGTVYNSSIANLDNISFKVFLDAGTYTLRLLAIKFSVGGIADVDIDEVEVASFDLYSAVTVYNSIVSQTGIVISTSGLKTLKLRLHGSTGGSYYCAISSIALWRTA